MSFQQINLYQPIFRKQEKVFSAKAMAQSAAVVVVESWWWACWGFMASASGS